VSATIIEKSDVAASTQRLYARVWRWHFFAALIVIPFVLWQSVTGVLYLWNRELASLTHRELVHVAPAAEQASYQVQLAAVLGRQPVERLEAVEVSDDPALSTVFFFRDDNGLPYPAFVNPHTGAYLGAIASTHWIRGLTRGLHGGWPINPVGSYLLELGASWAIVMVLTGLYLWWPREGRGLAGVLYPRLRSGTRTLWRDLHATVGVYFALIFLAFLVSALPWTTLWGGEILAAIQAATNQQSPTAFFFAGGADHHHATTPGGSGHDHAHHGTTHAQTLDELVAKARAAGARGTIELQTRNDGSPVNVRDQHPRSRDEVWLQLDGRSGAVLTTAVSSDFPVIPRLVSVGIDLHEGSFFGRANQIFNTLMATALVWLSVTGFICWYKRRPRGSLAAPPKRALLYPKTVIATGGALCIALPLLGLSVLGIALLDHVLGRFLPARN
jgi:uncharacterized iron-regulated membrane protein